LKSKPVVTFGRFSALAARPAGGFFTQNMMYQLDAIENLVGHCVQSHLHKYADGDFNYPDRILVESY